MNRKQILESILKQLKEKKEQDPQASGAHKWIAAELDKENVQEQDAIEDAVISPTEEKKNKYNPWSKSKKIAGSRERKGKFSVDDTWPKGMGPKEYLKKIGLSEALNSFIKNK